MHPTPISGLLREAERCAREGRVDEGIDFYLRALAIRADLPDAWFNLGWLQRSARRFDDALASYSQAVAHGVTKPEEAHLNRAVILSEHRLDTCAAIVELTAAVTIEPRFLPAWLNLGHLHEDMGEVDEARRAYARALQLAPDNGRAHARLAAIDAATDTGGSAGRLRAALAQARHPEDRADLLFALGSALDAQGSYDDAFDAIAVANGLAADLSARPYSQQGHEALIDRIIATFDQPSAGEATTGGPTPVFICGMFRSGSTLCEQMLGRHPLIHPGGELDRIPALVQALGTGYPSRWREVDEGARREFARGYRDELARIGQGAAFVTDKRCDNFLHIGLIKSLFPDARIIHTRRQPLDTVLSLFFLRFGVEVGYAADLADAAHYHIQHDRLMAHWRTVYGLDIGTFDYDAAVVDPRAQVTAMLDHLGLSWDDACLVPESSDRVVRTASAWQVRQPLHARSSGRWRHYERHLAEARAMFETRQPSVQPALGDTSPRSATVNNLVR